MIRRFIFLFALSFSISAAEWEVKEKNGEFVLISPLGESYTIESVGGRPKFVKAVPFEKDFLQVIYRAGSAGTSQIIEVTNALIVTKKNHHYLGSAIFKYKAGPGTTYKVEQPVWKIKGQVVEVTDPESPKKTIIILIK